MNEPLRATVVAARLPDGRILIASLDPDVPDHHSPLRKHLRTETPRTHPDREPTPC